MTAKMNWANYASEAALLGLFMIAACAVVTAVAHPASPIAKRVRAALARRAIIGSLMGMTAVALISSPLGKLSGGHMNPSVTLAFSALGKVDAVDAVMYVLSQVVGAVTGVALCAIVAGKWVHHEAVRCAATSPGLPGRRGIALACAAEFVISFVLFFVVLLLSNDTRWMGVTPYAAGLLVALYITFEAPISGMSMNPARTLGSALFARVWRGLWLYFVVPPAAMLLAGAVYLWLPGSREVYCAKLDHTGDVPCAFHCRIQELLREAR